MDGMDELMNQSLRFMTVTEDIYKKNDTTVYQTDSKTQWRGILSLFHIHIYKKLFATFSGRTT